jgi:hypothetical protein
MSETSATPNVLQVRLSHILVFAIAVAFVLAFEIAVARAASLETAQRLMASMQPQIALFFAFDAMAKASAICGIFALMAHHFKRVEYVAHPAEYLWIIVGVGVTANLISAFWPYMPHDIIYLFSGLVAAWLSRENRWKWFYLLVAFSPLFPLFLIQVVRTSNTFSFHYFNLILATKDIAISSMLIGYIIGTRLTWSAWAGVISQFSLTGVWFAYFLLVFFDLWK